MARPSFVRIVEVGPRDGLQNEPGIVPLAAKVALVEALADAGLKVIEAGSFVSPKWVPQMADTAQLLAALKRRPGVRYTVLTPNLKGLEQALAAQAEEVAVFAAASEAFSAKNINCTIAESLERFAPVLDIARANGIAVRGYVSCVLGCPYQGEVPVAKVVEVSQALVAMGCYEVSLGDTIGVGTPDKAKAMAKAVVDQIGAARTALHFHDTYGQALANVLACLDLGIASVDAAVSGLGGCPYAKGASGNLATEDLVYMLDGLGIETGVDLDRLAAAGRAITEALGRPSASKTARALAARAG
ncbi:hydroxymethylglutaryl-CoA lyase [Xanthobacter sp. KR7-225]|uniref:hydroxymethylglutaryl-CoA lyase n=1 Tax=Xanthobacter sp. KR7-225 TaxID=3156613 RepID=UPI0032B4769B